MEALQKLEPFPLESFRFESRKDVLGHRPDKSVGHVPRRVKPSRAEVSAERGDEAWPESFSSDQGGAAR
jgi:hypothetical protein